MADNESRPALAHRAAGMLRNYPDLRNERQDTAPLTPAASAPPWIDRPPLTTADILHGLRPWLTSSDDAEVIAASFVLANLRHLPQGVSVHVVRTWFFRWRRQPPGLFGPGRALVFEPRVRLIVNELLQRIAARDLGGGHD